MSKKSKCKSSVKAESIKGSKKKSKKAKAPEKASKKSRELQASSIADILKSMTCPCCSKRCSLAKPKCGKGRAVAKKKMEKVA